MSQQKPKISTSFSYETLEETLDIKPKVKGMMIGIPKEIAFQENRIALTPDAVSVLVSNGHQVMIEHNAGEASHFRDCLVYTSDAADASLRVDLGGLSLINKQRTELHQRLSSPD